jgi:hypothetical protein
LLEEGHTVDLKALSTLSPYRTEHINRFGNYVINPNRMPELLEQTWGFHYHQSRLDFGDLCGFYQNPYRPSIWPRTSALSEQWIRLAPISAAWNRQRQKKQFPISSESVLTPVGFGSVSLAQDFGHTENHRTIKKKLRRYE